MGAGRGSCSEPENIGALARAWGAWGVSVAARTAAVARTNWALTAGIAMLGLLLVLGPGARRERELRWQAEELRARAEADVEELLRLIGHGVTVSGVEAAPMRFYGATYAPGRQVITINSNLEWGPKALLRAMAHECSHAILDEAGLSRYGRSQEHALLEETAAEVMGAYLAGRVWSARGNDGSALTREIIAGFKAACSGTVSDPRREIVRRLVESRGREVELEEVELVVTHYGSEQLVSEVDGICRRFPDIWEAAHVIAERFRLADRDVCL